MPYLSAAEKRRQRAAETAHDLEQERMFEGFGRNEKTGIGARANHGDSVTRVTQPGVPSHASNEAAPPQQASPLRYSPAGRHLAPLPRGGYQTSEVSAVAPSAVSAPPTSVVSASPFRQPPPAPQASSPYVGNNVHQFDPEMFGNNSPGAPRRAAPPVERWAEPVQPPAPRQQQPAHHQQRNLPAMEYAPAPPRGPMNAGGGAAQPSQYAPHPLEYDGGAPLPDEIVDSHFGGRHVSNVAHVSGDPVAHEHNLNASSRALEEYYNRTRGPIIDDTDRAAIEDFFATDDFTEQFNARAAQMRAEKARRERGARQQQQQLAPAAERRQQLPPMERATGAGVSSVPSEVGAPLSAYDEPDDDPRYPLCHRCHQAAVAADADQRRTAGRKGTKSGPGTSRAVSGASRRPPRKVPAMKPTTGRAFR